MKKLICLLPITLAAAFSQAGTLDLRAQGNSGIYDSTGTSLLVQDSQFNTGSYSGLGAFGPISATSNAVDPTGGQSVSASNTVSANITSETSGSITIADGWNSNLSTSQGFANVYPGASTALYTFTTAGSASLVASFMASFVSAGSGTPGFGLWNPLLIVDGVQYSILPPSSGWVTPLATGSWTINLVGAGTHTVGLYDFSNVSGGLGVESMTLNETLNFSTQAVPEPISMVGLATGALFFLRKRTSK
jgi:hypothetical protein